MRILIVGGTGQISTAISRQLLARGDDLTLLNRGKTPIRLPPPVQRIAGDRTDRPTFEAQLRAAGPFDAVIDMVCFSPEDAESLVRACRGCTRQVVLCSTVDVYAKPASHYPIDEEERLSPLTSYGTKKVACETILLSAGERGDFAATVLRPAYTYGEGRTLLDPLGLRPVWLDRLRRGQPVVVHGDGSSFWASCYVDDVARAFVGALGNGAASGRCYHVAGEEWLTWNRYVTLIAEAMGAPPPRLVHIPTEVLAKVAPRRTRGCLFNWQYSNIFDNTRARTDLGFRYTVPFVEGVRRTLRWLEANAKIEDSDRDPFDDRLIAAWERLGAGLVEALVGLDEMA